MPQPLLALRIPARPPSLSNARRSLDVLSDRVPAQRLWDLKLMVNELVSNSILHGDLAADHHIEVHVAWTPDVLRVDVCDSAPPERYWTPHQPGIERETGGWGLYLVETLSDRWGVAGTCVWFEMDLAAG